jgi:Transglycosylase-like domain
MSNWSGRTQPPRPTSTAAVVLLAAVLLVAIVVAVARANTDTQTRITQKRVIGYGQIKYHGAGPEKWAQRWRREHKRFLAVRAVLRRQRYALLRKPLVVEAVNLAIATYGHGAELWRKARCETGGTLDPRSRNRGSGAAGLFQFMPDTWRSTPYGRLSVWSPYANALAAGWMHAHGRGDEWACR